MLEEQRVGRAWMLLPALALLLVAFVVPMGLMVRMSLNGTTTRPYASALTFDNYQRFVSPLYLGLLWKTVRLTLVITFLSIVIGAPYAYLMWRSSGLKRTLLLAIALLPLFTNVIARLYGWQILLSREGPVNDVLRALGLVDEPLRLNFSFVGATVGLTYVAAPYFTLIYFSALASLDWSLVEAARTLGAGRFRSLGSVVLPLSSAGLASGIAVAFAWGMGAYAETVTLGSSNEWGLGYEAWRQHTLARNWPFSAVLSIVMIVSTLALIVFAMRATARATGAEAPA